MIAIKFMSASQDQINFSGGGDPRGVLKTNSTYMLEYANLKSSYTLYKLVGFDRLYNSVFFDTSADALPEELKRNEYINVNNLNYGEKKC